MITRWVCMFVLGCVLLSSACAPAISTETDSAEPTAVAVPTDDSGESFDEPFTLLVGDTAEVANTLWVTFDSVPEDTRCPAEVECEWSGLARVLIAVGEAGGAEGEVFEYNTNPGDPMMRVRFEGYQLTLQSLDPYPQHPDRPIDPETYEIKLTVTNRDN